MMVQNLSLSGRFPFSFFPPLQTLARLLASQHRSSLDPGRVPVRATCVRGPPWPGQGRISGLQNSMMRWASVSERARCEPEWTAARSQHVTRRLRSRERPPLSGVRTAHVAACTASTLIHSPLQQRRCLQTFILFFPTPPPPQPPHMWTTFTGCLSTTWKHN